MNPDRTRWGDSRLDDLANELRTLRDIPAKVAELFVELRNLKAALESCSLDVKEHREDFQSYIEEQDKTHEAHRLERKSDRRWIVGTVFTAAALVVATISLLAGNV